MNKYPPLNYNLLLIEDNPGDVILIQEYLEAISIDLNVNVEINYKGAQDFLKNSSVEIDLILLDLKLPDMEGEKLIREILNLAQSKPVIVLTGNSDMQFSIKSLSLGVSDYIVKDDLNKNDLWKSILFSIERNEASGKLKRSEERYRYLFENNPLPTLIWSLENRRILDSNQEAEKKYGYKKKELKTLTIDSLQKYSSGDVLPENAEEFEEGVDLKIKGEIHTNVKSNGETFFAEMKGHYINYLGKPSVLLLVNDITEKVEMQERMLENSIQAEEAERNRIASELHDGIVQQLVACGMFVETLERKVEDDGILNDEVNRLLGLLKKTTIQTRDISHNLKSAEFENSKLSELLKQLINQLNNASSIDFIYNSHLGLDTNYSVTVKTQIYRSVQELCNNVIKHSNASKAVLTIEQINGVLFFTIKDDGEGFDYSQNGTMGMGLKNVESRMLRLGGKFEFDNVQSDGFQVNLEIPVNKNG